MHMKRLIKKSGGNEEFVQEMWDTIIAEDDEGGGLVNDDEFKDGSGFDPSSQYYGSDSTQNSTYQIPLWKTQIFDDLEEDEDITDMFKRGMKKRKKGKSAAEIAFQVESVMAQFELVAEEDAELNRRAKPAINKLKKLPRLIDVLSKKQLQTEFLDHGVLTILKTWLEPLPDGSLPNINIRAAILKILSDLPIDMGQYDRREQVKKSGLGKVIMFLSKSDEETPSNRKLAKVLVDQWSRPIFNKSMRFEDMGRAEDERASRRPSPKNRPLNRERFNESKHDNLDISEESIGGESWSRLRALRPEAISMDFVVRPQSNVDYEKVRARARQMMPNPRHFKMNKKMEELRAPKKKHLQAIKISVKGRDMAKYL